MSQQSSSNYSMRSRTNVLTIAGHDPTGGAGIQADIEVINNMQCHACSIITTLTVQNTQNVITISPVATDLINTQLQILCEDISLSAIKIGLLGSTKTVNIITQRLKQYKDIPIVCDPVLSAGGGTVLAQPELIDVLRRKLLPLTTLVTPNSLEARQLAPEGRDLNQCAKTILSSGCQFVLITGTHEPSDDVINQLYDQHGLVKSYHWPRLPYEYHGSGCTLSTAIATQLAQGATMTDAVEQAQQYTWDSLNTGYQPGQHQYVPNRLRN
ncbi:MAG: bifunctional hydroxymethylpyrimidine kinase/phosphomethylpyrimidine kinase [Methylococcales bacterium]